MTISQDSDSSRPLVKDGSDNATAATPESEMTTVTKLYRHDCNYKSCPTRWSEFAVVKEEQEDLTKRIAQIPIIHRHTYENEQWVTSSFTIQSSTMKDLFKKALEKYQDLDMELENWTFQPPYMPIVHRWDRLKELQASTTDPIEKKAADTLMEFLTPILAPSVDSLSQTRRTGKVSFESVWQIFPPGELVVTKFFGVETVCRVLKYERQQIKMVPVWIITVEYVDWNGKSCGYATTKTTIISFCGFRRVTALPGYPLSFDEAAAEIQSKMVERGRKFERFRGYHFLTCSGKKVLLDNSEERPVSGRVVIDAFAYYRSCNIVKPDLGSLFDETPARTDTMQNDECLQASSDPGSVLGGLELTAENVFRCEDLTPLTDELCLLENEGYGRRREVRLEDRYATPPRREEPRFEEKFYAEERYGPPARRRRVDRQDEGHFGPPPPPRRPELIPPRAPAYADPRYPEREYDDREYRIKERDTGPVLEGPELTAAAMSENVSRGEDLTPLTDEHCLLATPWLKGMDFKTKEWGQFHIDELKEIVWNDRAFDNLVLPGGEKELAWDFVESKNLSNCAYDDFIPEKGRGIIILMFGPPGVGKTYTAEAVTEKSRVPLYSMSAGVLGTKPEEVEKSLDRALELCRLWNAMLLLDEADVFLGARTNDGLARNELVSIFLTKLEYYQGILFLTTNRVSSIDHAFQSRVDLFLPYFELTAEARRQVWENFINHIGSDKFDVSESNLDKLSKVSLNGREIKNLIKSSQLLSFKSAGKVTAERLYMLAEKRVKALQLLSDQVNAAKY